MKRAAIAGTTIAGKFRSYYILQKIYLLITFTEEKKK